MGRTERRRVGRYEFTLLVIGPDPERQGKWHWRLNGADTEQTDFGSGLADGIADTEQDALGALEDAFRHALELPRKPSRT